MDIDAIAKQMPALLAFKDKVEAMIAGAGEAKSDARDDLSELLAFKSEIQGMLPLFEKAISDASLAVAEITSLKEEIAPILAWIAEQQETAQKAADASSATKGAEDHAETEQHDG